MLSFVAALCPLALSLSATAYDTSSRFKRFSSKGYALQGRADPEKEIPLVIGLYPADFGGLEQEFYQVSDPRSIAYGHYLAQEEIDKLSQPTIGALDAVRQWISGTLPFESVGIFSATSNLYKISMKVKHAERLLHTQIHHYEAEELESVPAWKRHRMMRALTDISVPEHLQDYVSFVSVNTHPLGLRALRSASSSDTMEFPGTTVNNLAQLRTMYNIPDDLRVTNASNSQCVPSFFEEAYDPQDLARFFSKFLPGESIPQIIEKGNRINQAERPSLESSLDLQYITGLARNATTYLWSMNGTNPYSSDDEPFLEFAEDVLAQKNPPLVVSISYSDDEEHIFNVSPGYARTLDTLFIKMGLRGITVLVASGDDGVTGLRTEFEKIPMEDMCKKSGPQWPSSSPYITSVGATMLLAESQQAAKMFFRTKEEVVCSTETNGMITSGGGFSNIYSIPEYQRTAVERYMKTWNIPTLPNFFRESGRAYPDVAALGSNFLIFIKGQISPVSGTSASTPVIGAMVTLWNDVRLNAGKSPLGFINPLLYHLSETHPDAFHDVVVGNNGAHRRGNTPCDESFSAAAGWDAVSGVGSPNFSVINDIIANLENHFNASQLGKMNISGITSVSSDAIIAKSDSGEANTFMMVLFVAAVVANVAIGFVVVVAMIKRWRNQYTPLNDAVCGLTPSSVSTAIPLKSVKQLKLDAGNVEDVELSEINLN
ncbi:uncharacterized protein CCR75_008733 [Bremia lactucae]|uniref:subtilisin n=1 Tax=Bremia lactucae TaxID=4779 RepID=A0A976IG95_BRELC|nr:hypothetical protein CCR75_008733 [Bremia lactucae]